MSRREFIERVAIAVTKRYLDEGRLIEAGWAAFRHYCVAPDAPPDQVTEMRFAFMAGSEHLWASMMGTLDEDREPNADDLRRMDLIQIELMSFRAELEERVNPPQGGNQARGER